MDHHPADKVMEDITNYPENTSPQSFNKEPSFQKMEEENDPADNQLSGSVFREPSRDAPTQTRNQALLQLLKSYSAFINESSDVILDMDVVLNRLIETTRSLKPPVNASNRTIKLWDYLLELDKPSIESYSNNLKALPESNLLDCVQDIEKLYLKLMIEFNNEMRRGKQLGIINNNSDKF